MRPSHPLRSAPPGLWPGLCLGLCLLGALARAQPAPSAPGRALFLTPRASSAPVVYLAPRLATTLEVDFPLRHAQLEGPGAEALHLQTLEPQVLLLYASRPLGPSQRPTLTLTSEDGASHPLALSTQGPADSKVLVHRAACVLPEDASALGAALLLRQPLSQLASASYHWDRSHQTPGAPLPRVLATVPLARLALLVLKVTPSFPRSTARLEGPSGPAWVLGVGAQEAENRLPILVERPPGDPDGLPYTLTIEERDGPRQFVLHAVRPWPHPTLEPPGPGGNGPEGHHDVGHSKGQLPPPQPGPQGG